MDSNKVLTGAFRRKKQSLLATASGGVGAPRSDVSFACSKGDRILAEMQVDYKAETYIARSKVRGVRYDE